MVAVQCTDVVLLAHRRYPVGRDWLGNNVWMNGGTFEKPRQYKSRVMSST